MVIVEIQLQGFLALTFYQAWKLHMRSKRILDCSSITTMSHYRKPETIVRTIFPPACSYQTHPELQNVLSGIEPGISL
jgi:hypothetical protein